MVAEFEETRRRGWSLGMEEMEEMKERPLANALLSLSRFHLFESLVREGGAERHRERVGKPIIPSCE